MSRAICLASLLVTITVLTLAGCVSQQHFTAPPPMLVVLPPTLNDGNTILITIEPRGDGGRFLMEHGGEASRVQLWTTVDGEPGEILLTSEHIAGLNELPDNPRTLITVDSNVNASNWGDTAVQVLCWLDDGSNVAWAPVFSHHPAPEPAP